MSKKKPKFKNRAFAERFRELLQEVPEGCSLAEWQQIYRDVMFSMGMHILERFPEDATRGRHPKVMHSGGGPGGGGHPSLLPCNFVEFPAFVLCLSADPPVR